MSEWQHEKARNRRASATEWSIVIAFSVGVGTIVWGLLHAVVALTLAVLS